MTTPIDTRTQRRIVIPDRRDVAINTSIVVGLWMVYSIVRSTTSGLTERALANAADVVSFHQGYGLDIEADLQGLVSDSTAVVAANVYYLVHFPSLRS